MLPASSSSSKIEPKHLRSKISISRDLWTKGIDRISYADMLKWVMADRKLGCWVWLPRQGTLPVRPNEAYPSGSIVQRFQQLHPQQSVISWGGNRKLVLPPGGRCSTTSSTTCTFSGSNSWPATQCQMGKSMPSKMLLVRRRSPLPLMQGAIVEEKELHRWL